MLSKSKLRIVWAIAIMGMTTMTACSKTEEQQPEDTTKSKNVTLSRKTDYGDDWIYFSLREGKELSIAEANHKTDLSWDLAFNRYNVRTNSGLSGNGQGGALKTESTSFDDVNAVPAGQFAIDTVYIISAPGSGFPPPTMESTANLVLCEAIAFSGPPPAYTPSPNVFIVRLADGRYAKFMAIGFYNDEGVSGYYTFKYALLD